jgi:hypothetical protein
MGCRAVSRVSGAVLGEAASLASPPACRRMRRALAPGARWWVGTTRCGRRELRGGGPGSSKPVEEPDAVFSNRRDVFEERREARNAVRGRLGHHRAARAALRPARDAREGDCPVANRASAATGLSHVSGSPRVVAGRGHYRSRPAAWWRPTHRQNHRLHLPAATPVPEGVGPVSPGNRPFYAGRRRVMSAGIPHSCSVV